MPQQLELPRYKATKSQDFPGFLIVWCPREDCPSFEKRPQVIHEATWLRPMRRRLKAGAREQTATITGRPCPYCFRAARVPRRSEIG